MTSKGWQRWAVLALVAALGPPLGGCTARLVFADASGHLTIGKPAPDATPDNPTKGAVAGLAWSTPGGKFDSFADAQAAGDATEWLIGRVGRIFEVAGTTLVGLVSPIFGITPAGP